MMSHNYDVAAQNRKSSLSSPGADLYKSPFADTSRANYVWSDRAQSLNDIIKENSLPVVVKLCNDNVVKEEETPVDLQRPLLLYKEVKDKKLHARNLLARPAAKEASRFVYQPVGPYVTFSGKFPGFFKNLDAKDHPLLTMADVNRLMPVSFISAEPCSGYICIQQLEQDALYQKATLEPGLYRPGHIVEDTITYINKRKSEKKKRLRCLSCEDEKGKIVIFPLETKGSFYISEISTKSSKHFNASPGCRVYKWTEFDGTRVKGLRAKMAYGKPPQQECRFTGLLEFHHVTEEHTVIGATMTSQPRLFEMAVTDEPFFILALNSDDQDGGTLQQKCVKFARTECDSYMQMIKVRKDYDIDQVEST